MYEGIYDNEMKEGALPFELPGWIAAAPFEEFLDMRIEEAQEGRALLTMPFQVKHSQGKGLMHGGAVTALADTAVAMAIKSTLPPDTHFATVEMSLSFFAPVTEGRVTAVARIAERDGRKIRGEADVFDQKGTKVASFRSLFIVKRPEQGA